MTQQQYTFHSLNPAPLHIPSKKTTTKSVSVFGAKVQLLAPLLSAQGAKNKFFNFFKNATITFLVQKNWDLHH